MDISIIIPAYNEEQRILDSFLKIKKYFTASDKSFEIIIINDGSIDNTNKILSKLRAEKNVKVLTHDNYGKGYAVRMGVLSSKGDKILITDADLSTSIEQYAKLEKTYSKGYDVCIGSRRLKHSKIQKKQPIHREVSGRLFNLIVRALFSLKISDTQCGFKLLNAKKIKPLFKKCIINRFAYDVEILYLAKIKNLKIAEIPIIWIDSPKYSKIRFFRDSINMFTDLIKIKLHNYSK